MSFSESDLEKSLRTAPRPQPPADLEQQLMAEIPRSARWRFPHFEPADWVRRWWPALAPAALSVACAAIITAQQMEIHELKQTSQAAAQSVSPGDATAQAAPDANLTNSSLQNAADAEQAEIQRLRELLVQLSQEITHLQQMKA